MKKFLHTRNINVFETFFRVDLLADIAKVQNMPISTKVFGANSGLARAGID